MADPLAEAMRLLSHFWLEEVRPADLPVITALPELADTLAQTDKGTLSDLAVEYQRLFGFNLPPYESIFIDPSVMLLAPATARVQALYRQAGWMPPANIRVGALDHLGLELLALAELRTKAEAKKEFMGLARRLQTEHLALWVPPLVLTLRRLAPHPFYAILGELTLELLLATLPADSLFASLADPFPMLPPPPLYKDRLNTEVDIEEEMDFSQDITTEPEAGLGLRELVKRLLTPCEAGLFLTREDIAGISRTLDLPSLVGERASMLETLFRQAGEYQLVPALLDQLRWLLAEVDTTYQLWADEYPAWNPYARAWCKRAANTRDILTASAEIA